MNIIQKYINELKSINYKIIYNGSDLTVFYPLIYKNIDKNKIKIVTHHFSDNINKGYDIYYKLYQYSLVNSNIEFIFYGRKFNDNYKAM